MSPNRAAVEQEETPALTYILHYNDKVLPVICWVIVVFGVYFIAHGIRGKRELLNQHTVYDKDWTAITGDTFQLV